MGGAMRAAAVAAIVVAGLAAGFLSYRQLQPKSSSVTLAPPATGVARDASGEDAPPRAVPASVPDVRLPGPDGQSHSLRAYLGHPLIINFWATWCAPCRREMPLLADLHRDYALQQLQIVGVAIDFQAAVQDFVAHTPVNYPLLVGEQQGLDAVQQFGMEPVLPFSVFALGNGDIVTVKIGELHRDEADFILAQMHNLAAGQATLPAARAAIAAGLQQLSIERAKRTKSDS